jgi:hypothetical protein
MAGKTKRNKLAASKSVSRPRMKFHQSRLRPSSPVPTNQEIRATLSRTTLAPSIVEVISRSIAGLPAEDRRWMTEIAASWERLVPRREGAVPPPYLSNGGKQKFHRLVLEVHAKFSRFTDVADLIRALEDGQLTTGSPDLEALYGLQAAGIADAVDALAAVDAPVEMGEFAEAHGEPSSASPTVSVAAAEAQALTAEEVRARAMAPLTPAQADIVALALSNPPQGPSDYVREALRSYKSRVRDGGTLPTRTSQK